LILVCIFQAREAGRGKEHSDTHQVVSEQEILFVYFRQREKVKEDRELEDSVRIVCR
jgi:hypothetical protein